jgi:hypothetical protein
LVREKKNDKRNKERRTLPRSDAKKLSRVPILIGPLGVCFFSADMEPKKLTICKTVVAKKKEEFKELELEEENLIRDMKYLKS